MVQIVRKEATRKPGEIDFEKRKKKGLIYERNDKRRWKESCVWKLFSGVEFRR